MIQRVGDINGIDTYSVTPDALRVTTELFSIRRHEDGRMVFAVNGDESITPQEALEIVGLLTLTMQWVLRLLQDNQPNDAA